MHLVRCMQESGFTKSADNYNHLSGFSYDLAGNTANDGVYGYAWNAESDLKTAVGVNYVYDGDGRRAYKANSANVPYKVYWYGAGGEILAETDGSGNTSNEYVFFGGKRVALLPAGSSAQFYAEDMLGSTRVVTSNTGVVCYDADSYPFGGERTPYTNSCTQNNYKFEGKERDAETGNDDFGARYYSNRFGRWLSADWSSVPVAVPYANLTNPQTLNLYAMVADDPESFADLDGHCSGDDCSKITVSAEITKQASLESSKNGPISTATVEGEVQYTVKYDGKPMADTPIHEDVSNKTTFDGIPRPSKTETRDGSTNKQGVIVDQSSMTVSTPAPSAPGTNAAEQVMTTNVYTKETTQTLTTTSPSGCSCSVTEKRTLSNASGAYKLTLESPQTRQATVAPPKPQPPPPPKNPQNP